MKINFDLKINQHLIDNLERISRKGTVRVGWFEGQNYDDGTPIALVASVNEFGATINVTQKMRGWFLANGYPLRKDTTQIFIPARSFMRSTADNKQQDWREKIEKELKAVIDGKIDFETALERLGLKMKGDIQTTISEIMTPPNSAMTQERKGFNKPLINTGIMMESIQVKTEVN